jgi:putative hydrolase
MIHWGVEAKGMDTRGTLAANPEMIEAAGYVLGAFHSSQTDIKFPNLHRDEAIEMEYSVILGMLKARACHAIAHPGGLSTKFHGGFDDSLFDQLAWHASDNGVALELNPGYGGDIGEQLATCIKYGTGVVLGSNAHEISDLGRVVRTLEALPASHRKTE